MQKYRVDVKNYQEWYRKNANGAFMLGSKCLVYIDSDYTSVHGGEDCVSVHEVDGAIGCGAVPKRFLIPVED